MKSMKTTQGTVPVAILLLRHSLRHMDIHCAATDLLTL